MTGEPSPASQGSLQGEEALFLSELQRDMGVAEGKPQRQIRGKSEANPEANPEANCRAPTIP